MCQHLDRVFPGFGWARDTEGWAETNDASTLSVPMNRSVRMGARESGLRVATVVP